MGRKRTTEKGTRSEQMVTTLTEDEAKAVRDLAFARSTAEDRVTVSDIIRECIVKVLKLKP